MKYKIKIRSMITVIDIVTLPDVHSDEYEYNSGTYYSDVQDIVQDMVTVTEVFSVMTSLQ